VLAFFKTIDQHFKHLLTSLNANDRNRLVVSASKMVLFKAQIRFIRHDIFQGTIKPIVRSLAFANKFLDIIKDKK